MKLGGLSCDSMEYGWRGGSGGPVDGFKARTCDGVEGFCHTQFSYKKKICYDRGSNKSICGINVRKQFPFTQYLTSLHIASHSTSRHNIFLHTVLHVTTHSFTQYFTSQHNPSHSTSRQNTFLHTVLHVRTHPFTQ